MASRVLQTGTQAGRLAALGHRHDRVALALCDGPAGAAAAVGLVRLYVCAAAAEVIRSEKRVASEAADRFLEEAVLAKRSERAEEIVELAFVLVQVAKQICGQRKKVESDGPSGSSAPKSQLYLPG